MPIPSELQNERPRRSVFGNYNPPATAARDSVTDCGGPPPLSNAASETKPPKNACSPKGDGAEIGSPTTLQSAIDHAIARSFICRLLARAFENPDPEGWHWLTSASTRRTFRSALDAAALSSRANLEWLDAGAFEPFANAYIACFGHTVRGDCPMNEIEYGDIKADPLFQPHRLADLGAFYSVFGLEVGADAAERIDHISIELEFMSVLTAKEAYALEHQLDDEQLHLVRDAQKKFLREHLGRWTPAFSRRLAKMAGDTPLGGAARLLGDFIKLECARLNIPPGSEDLLLRPVDEAAEKLCASCGINNLPPGALTSPNNE